MNWRQEETMAVSPVSRVASIRRLAELLDTFVEPISALGPMTKTLA
jgi:hypothetical protein